MTTDEEDEVIAKLSDYVDGAKDPETTAKIANDPDWKRIHDEVIESREAAKQLSGLRRAHAGFTAEDVTGTIEKRSAGRFFARRTFGDRVPFGALLVVALIALVAIGYLMWSSSTGSLKPERAPEDHRSETIVTPP